MKVLLDSRFGEIDVSGSAEDYASLEALVRRGAGALTVDSADAEVRGRLALSLIGISTVPGQAALVRAETAERSLLISGDPRYLALLAGNIASLGKDQHGGHLHIEYFDDHAYLAKGSAPMILNSPRGGMPLGRTRTARA